MPRKRSSAEPMSAPSSSRWSRGTAGLTWAASVVKLGPRVQPTPVDRAWLKRLAWSPLGAVGAGLGRALGAISGSVARLVGWVRQG